ncbi:MAG: hypothetical protein RL104_889, partial [Bacteroidota bacterium]
MIFRTLAVAALCLVGSAALAQT